MPYTPPVGGASLHIGGTAGGTALHIGGGSTTDRTATAWGRGPPAHGFAVLRHTFRAAAWGRGPAPRGYCTAHYDPNLLSAVHLLRPGGWAEGPQACRSAQSPLLPAPDRSNHGRGRIAPGTGLRNAAATGWVYAPIRVSAGQSAWADGQARSNGAAGAWSDQPRLARTGLAVWADGPAQVNASSAAWVAAPALQQQAAAAWPGGHTLTLANVQPSADGPFLASRFLIGWQDGDLPDNTRRIGPPLPPVHPPPWGTALHLCAPLPGARLSIGARCPEFPWIIVPDKRFYRVFNAISVVRLPDRTPLPVTSLAIRTDADSWCWSLSANLSGSDAWSLIAPQAPAFLPREIEATVNGHVFGFLIDTPNLARQFGKTGLTITGRSRSAWLAAPFLAPTSGVVANPRTAQQIGEEALDNTGWTLDWGLPEWLVPGGLLAYSGTPMDRLIQITAPVDGCLLTDPSEQIIRAYLRYPSPSWDWDSLVPDVGIPESALISWQQQPDNRELYNGVYVSGTTYGALAHCVVTGSAGDLQAPMVADPLLCDVTGVAATARAISILSQSGTGYSIAAACLLTPFGGPGPGLLLPGQLVSLGGIKGRVRSVEIAATWSDKLTVRQTLAIERREVEA